MTARTSPVFLLAALLALPAAAQHLDRVTKPAPPESAAPAVRGEDSDDDGVLDGMDDCPATPAGAKVLSDGCTPRSDCRRPRGEEPVDDKGCAIERVYVLRGVTFEFDSARLTQQGRDTLKVIAEALRTYPDVRFELNGHTCWMGSDAYNQSLSERRARSAGAFLVEQGIRADRMKTQGFGESRPVDTNETRAGREYNRRVELKIIE